ncbi:MAG: ABC transporter ATP-binding protein [Candidatus Cloacimonetes bacterium]|nr:ABC transporter ATP-binding protein [Candidatus Cloacimonadota bacterium]
MKIENISVGYRDNEVISKLSVEFGKGDFCALLGPNGAGKSTLLKAMIGFLPLSSGEIKINDRAMSSWKKKELAQEISLIPQDFQLQFDHKVRELIMMGRFPYLGYWQNYSTKDMQIVDNIIKQLDLVEFAEKNFSQLSGGERQRVTIGRALAQQSETILMDEAFSHLDINHQLEIMQLLSKINKEQNKRIILVSHNINLASEYCDRIIMLKAGKLIADGTPEAVITDENIQELYGTRLMIIKNPVSGRPNLIYPGNEG